jgi:GntR family transcriptional regulator/MocR family aminotransferase
MRTAPPGVLPVIGIDRRSPTALHRQIYAGYRDAILERRLRPGQRLPSTRSLAAALEVSRIPVLNAFEQLLAEGYLESRTGSGTFVARSIPEEAATPSRPPSSRWLAPRAAPRVVARRAQGAVQDQVGPWLRNRGAFNVGQPPVEHFSARVWSSLVARHSRNPDPDLMHYGKPMGWLPLREAVAEYLRTARAVRCEAEQVMIVGGSQHALELTARVLLDHDSPVWVEDPGYFGARSALTLAGARLVPVPVDEEGLNVEAGVADCPRARAAFVTPSHQFPLGVTMSASRRLQLLDWARRSGAWIIEDDYDSEFRYGNLPIAALQGIDRDARVIYVGTFTKILFPAIRLGYVVIPTDLVEAFSEVRRAMDTFSPPFLQAVLTDFIREGHFARHIRRTRVLCGERRAAMAEALRTELGDALQIRGDDAGMYLAATLGRGLRDRDIAERAAREGLWVAPLSEAYIGRTSRQGLMLGYGGSTVGEIGAGVARLRDIVQAAQRFGRRSLSRR